MNNQWYDNTGNEIDMNDLFNDRSYVHINDLIADLSDYVYNKLNYPNDKNVDIVTFTRENFSRNNYKEAETAFTEGQKILIIELRLHFDDRKETHKFYVTRMENNSQEIGLVLYPYLETYTTNS